MKGSILGPPNWGRKLLRIKNERITRMRFQIKLEIFVFLCIGLACVPSALAQQKGQWVPGQLGLNAGVIPDPGITYANLALNYSADRLNNSNGDRIL